MQWILQEIMRREDFQTEITLSELRSSRLCFPALSQSRTWIKVQPQLQGFHADATPPFPCWMQEPKQTWRICINVSRPKERHRNIPNKQVKAALKEPFSSVPPPITLSIWSCYGDDNYSWSAGYSNYCNKNHIKLVTTCVRQGLSLQLCTFPCPPPPFKVGCLVCFSVVVFFLLQLCSKRQEIQLFLANINFAGDDGSCQQLFGWSQSGSLWLFPQQRR